MSVNFNIHGTQLVRISNALAVMALYICVHVPAARSLSLSAPGWLERLSEG